MEPSRLASFTETFRVRTADDSAGIMTLELRVTEDSLVSIIEGVFHDSLVQQVVLTYDSHGMRLREVRDSVPSRLEVLNYTGARLRGMVLVQNRRGTRDTFDVDIPIDSFTTDRRSLLTEVRWLPLETGRTYLYSMFDPDARRVYPLRASIRAKTTVEGPTGTFDAYRVELTTSPPKWFAPVSYLFPAVLWVRADSSRRVLRIERPRFGALYELTSEVRRAP